MSDAKEDVHDANAVNTGDMSNKVDEYSAPPNLLETQFSTKTWRDDLALIVEDKTLYVSKTMLACASPVFDTMFTGEFKERYLEEIVLPGRKYEDFVEFLQFIYPGMVKSITLDDVFKVYPLAHEYQVKNLMSAFEDCLIQHLSQNKNPKYLYEILEMTCIYKSTDNIKEKCIEIIVERSQDEFDEKKSKFTFSEDVINIIGTKMLLNLRTKYKDVFGHVKTSRALYQFLGRESKQKTLVEQHLNGRVVGDVVYLKVRSPTFEASSELCIGRNAFSLHVAPDKSVAYICNPPIKVDVELKSIMQQDTKVNGLIAVYILNWMKGKENIVNISDFHLKDKVRSFKIQFSSQQASIIKNEEAGFICKGQIDLCIYLFCL